MVADAPEAKTSQSSNMLGSIGPQAMKLGNAHRPATDLLIKSAMDLETPLNLARRTASADAAQHSAAITKQALARPGAGAGTQVSLAKDTADLKSLGLAAGTQSGLKTQQKRAGVVTPLLIQRSGATITDLSSLAGQETQALQNAAAIKAQKYATRNEMIGGLAGIGGAYAANTDKKKTLDGVLDELRTQQAVDRISAQPQRLSYDSSTGYSRAT